MTTTRFSYVAEPEHQPCFWTFIGLNFVSILSIGGLLSLLAFMVTLDFFVIILIDCPWFLTQG